MHQQTRACFEKSPFLDRCLLVSDAGQLFSDPGTGSEPEQDTSSQHYSTVSIEGLPDVNC